MNLQVGSRGEAVREWQELLNHAGLETAVDGVFGINTETSTRFLQERLGVHVDGIVGPVTLAAARAAFPDFYAGKDAALVRPAWGMIGLGIAGAILLWYFFRRKGG